MANLQFPTALEQKTSNLWNGTTGLVQEGSAYIVTNPTAGTGIALGGATVTDDSSSAGKGQITPFLICQNGWSAANPSAKTVYPLYIKLITTAVPTGVTTTGYYASFRLDNVTNKSSSANAATLTQPSQNLNTSVSFQSGSTTVVGGVATSAMTSGGRLVAHALLNTVIPVVNDTYIFTFGDNAMTTNVLLGGTTARFNTYPMPPIAVAPGWSFQMDLFGASMSGAPSYEFEYVYAER